MKLSDGEGGWPKRGENPDWFDEENNVICIEDKCREHHGCSITNDAEAVVDALLKKYGDYPILTKDSTGSIELLLHDGKKFTGWDRFSVQDIGEWPEAIGRFKEFERTLTLVDRR